MEEYTCMQITPLDQGKVPSLGNDPMLISLYPNGP